MKHTFELFYTYSQIAVFRPSLNNPFNDWTTRHVAQGFSWREGSVSFSTLDEAGRAETTFECQPSFVPVSKAIRAIVVPFEVDRGGKVECATIAQSMVVELKPGKYALHFEAGKKDNATAWIRFCFVPQDSVEPKVLVADANLAPQYPLLMSVAPAA